MINDSDKLRAQGVEFETVGDILAGGQSAQPEIAPTIASDCPNVKVYPNVDQKSQQWYDLRRGILTASEMHLIITPTLKVASNDKERAHLYELLAQRISGHVEPIYETYDMARGNVDEIEARDLYSQNIAPVEQVGFITNEKWGFKIGFSPDGLVGNDGLIEVKSRKQKLHIKTMLEHVAANTIDPDNMIQVQTGLMVSERGWVDMLSYSNGLAMTIVRVYPDEVIHNAIEEAAGAFNERLQDKMAIYEALVSSGARMIPTERRYEDFTS